MHDYVVEGLLISRQNFKMAGKILTLCDTSLYNFVSSNVGLDCDYNGALRKEDYSCWAQPQQVHL